MSTIPTQIPKVRLKFIDMARSIAILLMLEGHFIDETLVMEVRDPSNIVYFAWQFMRHFTAPIFLTVTGLIFTYLLLKKREEGLLENKRIRKGLKRVAELIFWGFLVQFNAFHVLECIAFGILSLLVIYAIYKLVKVIPLWIYFLVAGTSIFAYFPVVVEMPYGMSGPEHAWYSVIGYFFPDERYIIHFPTVPFVAFTMFGAMIGALLHDCNRHIKKFYFPMTFTIVGALLYFYSAEILGTMDVMLESIFDGSDFRIAGLRRLYEKLGMVLIVLSILIYIDNAWGAKIKGDNLFLKIGQNTLTIYVVHMLLLYVLVHAVGLKDDINHTFGPWASGLGAVGFVLIFVFIIKYLEQIKAALSKALEWINMGFTFLIERLRSPLNK